MLSDSSNLILALDAGTTGCKASLWDEDGKSLKQVTTPLSRSYPFPGFVEQEPQALLDAQMKAILDLLSITKTRLSSIRAIGITNQRETVVAWDKSTGRPIYPAISWMDKRKSGLRGVDEDYLSDLVKEKTGLLLDPYFSSYKMRWILRHIKKSSKNVQLNNLVFGTIDTWLIWNLTDKREFVTDWSNASRTMLFNIRDGVWDQELLELFGIEETMLPEVIGTIGLNLPTGSKILGRSIPITAIAGDQQASLFGHLCLNKGEVKNTYGTGSFLLMNSGTEVPKTKNLISTVAWKEYDKPTVYAVEGSEFNTGSLIDWIRDGLKILSDSSDSEEIAIRSPSDHGVYFVPGLNGLGAPYWNRSVKGVIYGMTPKVTNAEVVRSALESIAFRLRDITDAIKKETYIIPHDIAIDGKPSSNGFLMQFQADILGIPVIKNSYNELTSAGVALMAGKSDGYIDISRIKETRKPEKIYIPHMERRRAEKYYRGWKLAIEATIGFYNSLKR